MISRNCIQTLHHGVEVRHDTSHPVFDVSTALRRRRRRPGGARGVTLGTLVAEPWADYGLVDWGPIKGDDGRADAYALSLKRVVGGARTRIHYHAQGDRLYLFSLIDNLIKGAAGQAIENFNRLQGLAPSVSLEELEAAEVPDFDFEAAWRAVQAEQLELVESGFAPVPVLRAPYFEREVMGAEMLDRLAGEIFDDSAVDHPDLTCGGTADDNNVVGFLRHLFFFASVGSSRAGHALRSDLWPFMASVAIAQTGPNPCKRLDSSTSTLLGVHGGHSRGDGSHGYQRWFDVAVILP